MENVSVIGSVALITLLGTISPGPNFILTVRNSLCASRTAGIFTGLGTACGSVIHVLYSFVGVSILISQTFVLFTTLKLLGAGYRFYVGVKTCCSPRSSLHVESGNLGMISQFQAFKMGFLCNLLNPKASIFFLGLFATVITPSTPVWVLVLITGIMVVQNIGWFSLIALGASHPRIRTLFMRFQPVFQTVLGGLLILLGIKVAFSQL